MLTFSQLDYAEIVFSRKELVNLMETTRNVVFSPEAFLGIQRDRVAFVVHILSNLSHNFQFHG